MTSEQFDAFVLDESLSPSARRTLETALSDDPALADAVAQWQMTRAALRARLDDAVPNRSLLVCHALAAEGRADSLTQDERAALADARPTLDAAFAAHPALADVVRRIGEDAALFEAVWDEHTAPAAPRRAADRPAARRKGAPHPVVRTLWRLGMLVAVVGFVAVLTFIVQRDRGMTTVETAVGEMRLVTMADGSTARLLGASSLTYAEDRPNVRRARLSGSAFFDIVPNPAGFRIETTNALTTVLGTRLGVRADDRATEVVLETGRATLASLSDRAAFVVLEPGHRSRVDGTAAPTTPDAIDLAEALAWTGLFVFRDTPLTEIAEDLAEHYGVPVEVAPALASEALTGTFEDTQPLAEILATLAATLDATVTALPDGGFRLAR